ncbi:MAG: alpha/beta hydrolase [Acetilactobacillus jinshanensis]
MDPQYFNVKKSSYHINSYNAVAHSAGAVTVLDTTDKYNGQKNVVHLRRFASIAGPYDGVIGINDRPNQNTISQNGKPQIFRRGNRWYPGYSQLVQDSRHFPKDVKVLNIYGRLDREVNNDGYVTNVSAQSLKYLLKGRDDDYEEVPIYGRYAEHSLLHHNSVVDRIVNRFIFNE